MLNISPRKLRSDLYSHHDEPDMPLVVSVLAALIERHMARNERVSRNSRRVLVSKDARTRVFDALEAPDMTIQSFLERIFRYTKVGPSVYVVAYVYIDRLCQNYPGFKISPSNVHRLLITTIMVSSKYVEDMNYRNSYFARVGGLTTKEMNKLEVGFLFLMGFKLHVNVSVFESYCCHLEREVSIGGGYHIERALRCAEEIKLNQCVDKRFGQIARITL
ncbi:cyclin-U2-1-like [Chenopodium quinoa]|uniref:cyclin-U2-1-like n=1 Tax=Chenopodium quinoa TaxID=63459 RepID=UPI000B7993FD|nr:cyclin-U2-1-like [Chenopodium quinoa]